MGMATTPPARENSPPSTHGGNPDGHSDASYDQQVRENDTQRPIDTRPVMFPGQTYTNLEGFKDHTAYVTSIGPSCFRQQTTPMGRPHTSIR